MRHFHSYGPVNADVHFCVERRELVDQCTRRLIGDPGTGGHYFTLWAPRQAGKTWLMHQTINAIHAGFGGQFQVGALSMQGVVMPDDAPASEFLKYAPRLLRNGFGIPDPPEPANWSEWADWFHRSVGLFQQPVILFIDEFDNLPLSVIDQLVALFREMYLDRESYQLHGLALIGVRAVLGVGSHRGSPFNIQRAMHVPSFTLDETRALFAQYEADRGQPIEAEVILEVFRETNGQPGLVNWLGELLTEKYNPGPNRIITRETWRIVRHKAVYVEANNTVLNLIAKARAPEYQDFLMAMLSQPDVPFAFHDPICNHLYLNGIIAPDTVAAPGEPPREYCRFASPFVQSCLYSSLGIDMQKAMPIRPLDPLDDLSDVLDGPELDLPALISRYEDYLNRLHAAGYDIWKDQPTRSDMRIREASGHFHFYAWLLNAIGSHCSVSPEFPTGNGQVDIHIRCGDKHGIIEIKSFLDLRQIQKAKTRSAAYAAGVGLRSVAVLVFLSGATPAALRRISGEEVIDRVKVVVRAIGI
jgi:hypothetical protein